MQEIKILLFFPANCH